MKMIYVMLIILSGFIIGVLSYALFNSPMDKLGMVVSMILISLSVCTMVGCIRELTERTLNNIFINDVVREIEQHGFNGMTAMDIGTNLAMNYIDKTEEDCLKIHNMTRLGIEKYCRKHNVSLEDKMDFLMEVQEYANK